MKRFISLLLLLVLGLSLLSCEAFGPTFDAFVTTTEETTLDETTPEATTPEGTTPAPEVTTPAPGGTTPEPDGKITITFYHTMGQSLQAVLNDAIARFNKLYPNITIEHKTLGDYDALRAQISTDILVGGQPNVAYCYTDHVAFYNVAQVVQPLDSLIASVATVTRADGTTEQIGLTQAQIDNFIDAFYNEGRQFGDGKMYTMPMSKSTEVLYYNKTFFEKHNLKVPTTWDEMEMVCKQIKEIDPHSIPLGYDSEANWFITMCQQLNSPYTSATGEHYLFDNEINHAFVNKFASWYAQGLVTTQELAGAYTSTLFTWEEGQHGKCYMTIGSSAGARYQRPDKMNGEYAFEVGIAPIPQINPADPKVISQGPSICIFKDSNEQEVLASWLFVKFLTTDVVFQAEMAMTNGYVPVIKNVVKNEVYKAFLEDADGGDGISALAAIMSLAQVNAYFTTPAFNGSSKVREEVGLLMQACFANYKAAGDKMAMIRDEFKKCIEECNY